MRHSTDAYPVQLVIGILLERLFRKNTKVTDVPITLILPGQQHLSLRQVPLGVLLLLRDATDVLGLLALQLVQLASELL